jgi:hypothetical protein
MKLLMFPLCIFLAVAQTLGFEPQPAATFVLQDHRLVFEHRGSTFEAVVTVPPVEEKNGWGVLLVGGGVGNDLDWITPGSLEVDGKSIQMTLTGDAHADGPLLANAFAKYGFTVMRWSTIANDDPLANQWPLRATARSFSDLTSLSVAALKVLREFEDVDDDSILVVGHSLGAARAITLAQRDLGIRALALLAPAEVLSSPRTPTSIKQSPIVFLDSLLQQREIPVLAVFGGLDQSPAVDPSGVTELSRRKKCLIAKTFDGLGHQLGPEIDGCFGPISPSVLRFIAEWAGELVLEKPLKR